MSGQEVRPAAMRAFMTKFLPYIRQQFLDVAPVSYANEKTIGDKWRTQMVYDEKIADFLILKSKVFLSLVFPRTDKRHYDIDLLQDLSDMIAGYLALYVRRKHDQYAKQQAVKDIMQIIFVDNESIKRNIEKNAAMQDKKQKREAARTEAAAKAAQAPLRKKRPRIQTCIDEYNNIHRAVLVDVEREFHKKK